MYQNFKINDGSDPNPGEPNIVEINPAKRPPIKDGIDFLQAVQEIIDSVPMSEWEKLPRDGSERVDEILYGRGKPRE